MAGKPKSPLIDVALMWNSARAEGIKVGKKKFADNYQVSERTMRRWLAQAERLGLVPQGTMQPIPDRLKKPEPTYE